MQIEAGATSISTAASPLGGTITVHASVKGTAWVTVSSSAGGGHLYAANTPVAGHAAYGDTQAQYALLCKDAIGCK